MEEAGGMASRPHHRAPTRLGRGPHSPRQHVADPQGVAHMSTDHDNTDYSNHPDNERHHTDQHRDDERFERRHHHGRSGPRGDNPWEQIFGAEGPFGPRGPFGKGGPFGKSGIFGQQGADIARNIWENATAGGASFGTQDAPPSRGPWEPQEHLREHRGWVDHESGPGRPERRGPRRGGPGGPDGPGPRGHRGGPAGRRGRRPKGDVRLAALLLIAEEPRNGYQIIEELAARTSGAWRPSSGAVYPALAQLEDEGLIQAFESDGRKSFRLTDDGQRTVDANDAAAPWETATADAGEALGGRHGGEMWQAFGQVAMAAKAVSATRDAATMSEAAKVLDQARRNLYRILADGPQDAPVDDASDTTD